MHHVLGTFLLLLQEAGESTGVINYLVEKFNQGGGFMWPILACLVLGLAFVIFKFISLTRASTNTRKFIVDVKKALDEGGVDSALEVCSKNSSSVASVFQAGLMRVDEGIDAAEKAVISYGSIEMSFLERGLIWISTFISIAPLLGFSGTVAGMIQAFDSIAAAKNISPEIVASGISVALLTTLFGLIVAMILQVFYNSFVSRIDKLVVEMEESSIELIDSLVLLNRKKKTVN
ncbi:MAG: MotA/TolQ/ExbB proton channel family protein [Bacteroidetes bacterium]|nr:MotA/TolQ/ExbB proton channel family protein [Bacteroidota bacterium]